MSRDEQTETSWVHDADLPVHVVVPSGEHGKITTRGDAQSWVRLDSGACRLFWHRDLKAATSAPCTGQAERSEAAERGASLGDREVREVAAGKAGPPPINHDPSHPAAIPEEDREMMWTLLGGSFQLAMEPVFKVLESAYRLGRGPRSRAEISALGSIVIVEKIREVLGLMDTEDDLVEAVQHLRRERQALADVSVHAQEYVDGPENGSLSSLRKALDRFNSMDQRRASDEKPTTAGEGR